MAAELRWILAALSAFLLCGIWWWGVRRSRQAPGNAQLRETTSPTGGATPPVDFLGNGAAVDPPAADAHSDSKDATGARAEGIGSREWGVSPFEPLNIRTAGFEEVQLVDLPMRARPDPLEETVDMGAAERDVAAAKFVTAPLNEERFPPFPAAAPVPARVPTLRVVDIVKTASSPVREAQFAAPSQHGMVSTQDQSQSLARDFGVGETQSGAPLPSPDSAATVTVAPPHGPVANASEAQRIVTLRVSAVGDTRWSGGQLLSALEGHGLAHGRYQVFHRKHSDGRTIFCAASLVEPGSFDLEKMPREEYRGLTLFAVLPGPVESMQTVDALIDTAVRLAGTLDGTVQDSKGMPLTRQMAEALRGDVARSTAS